MISRPECLGGCFCHISCRDITHRHFRVHRAVHTGFCPVGRQIICQKNAPVLTRSSRGAATRYMAKTRVELFVHICLTTSDMPQMQTRHIMRQSALLLSPFYQTLYVLLRQESWRKNDINCVNQQGVWLYVETPDEKRGWLLKEWIQE